MAWRNQGRLGSPVRNQQRAFGLAQHLIEPGSAAPGISLLAADFGTGLLKLMGGANRVGKIRLLPAEYSLRFMARRLHIGADLLAIFLVVIGQHIGRWTCG